MDFRGKKQVIINGKAKSKLFYEDRLIWSKLYGEFSKDFKNLEEEEFFGNYDSQKGCLLVSNKFIRLAPLIEFEGENHAKVEYGENFEMPRVKAYTVSGEILNPQIEFYLNDSKVKEIDTSIPGVYELRYSVEFEGKSTQKSYYIEVNEPKVPSILDMTTYRKWGAVNISQNGDEYIISRPANNTASWGLVTGETMILENGVKYTLYAEIATNSLASLTYNYIISANGNQGIGNIALKTDGQYHKYLVEITPNKDRTKAGILFGGDKRKVNGDEFKIRNLAMYKGDYPYNL